MIAQLLARYAFKSAIENEVDSGRQHHARLFVVTSRFEARAAIAGKKKGLEKTLSL
jgi:hypothetical protein